MLPPFLCLAPQGHHADTLAPLVAALEALGVRAFAIDTLDAHGPPLPPEDADARVRLALVELDQRCELLPWGNALTLALQVIESAAPYITGLSAIAGEGQDLWPQNTVPLAYLVLEEASLTGGDRQRALAEALGADPVVTLNLGAEPLVTAAHHLADALLGIATTRSPA
ncbi:MAG: hypothetical protein ISQ55_00975 [Pseudomonadales bacterium]|nr:hypothetical protein [Pseudomonadales bacterium]MBL6807616.1 hypothetical protein [Pseudomonadales bacterium]